MVGRQFSLVLLTAPVVLVLCGCPTPDSAFEVIIERDFQTEEEEALILIAENVCPLREDVLAVARAQDWDALETEAGDDCLWWYTTWKLPYAITSGAINYWAAEVEQSRERANSRCWPLFPSSWLEYSATIGFHEEYEGDETQFENVYVVTMTMDYGWGGGFLSGEGFFKTRTVVLTAEGGVLAVFGDGETVMSVS